MRKPMSGSRWDVVVVGSGPGGAVVARELARAGRDVLILERGRDWRRSPVYGRYAGPLLYAQRSGLLFTREGFNIVRPLMVGGATSMYCGCSAPPRAWWSERYGIHLEADAEALSEELAIGPLPHELRGPASTRLAEAAGELGMEWEAQDKFMSPARVPRFQCGAHCMLGCRCGAKWNAGEFVDDAVEAGAELRTGARVDRVLVEGGAVAGVEGRRGGRRFRVEAERVVLAAGGIGTPLLLQRSGVEGAGQGLAMDSTVMVYGVAPFEGAGREPPMTWSWADDDLGVLYSTLIDPWLMYPIIMGVKGARWALTWPRWGRTLGVMIKLTDEVSGELRGERDIRKGLTPRDGARLARADEVARRILRKAGCDPDTFVTTPVRGTHPSATARIGHVVSSDLSTEVDGLYACDASVFPEALGRPTVLTILALGRRLARSLAAGPPRARGSHASVGDG